MKVSRPQARFLSSESVHRRRLVLGEVEERLAVASGSSHGWQKRRNPLSIWVGRSDGHGVVDRVRLGRLVVSAGEEGDCPLAGHLHSALHGRSHGRPQHLRHVAATGIEVEADKDEGSCHCSLVLCEAFQGLRDERPRNEERGFPGLGRDLSLSSASGKESSVSLTSMKNLPRDLFFNCFPLDC